jgi:hypothetical protein
VADLPFSYQRRFFLANTHLGLHSGFSDPAALSLDIKTSPAEPNSLRPFWHPIASGHWLKLGKSRTRFCWKSVKMMVVMALPLPRYGITGALVMGQTGIAASPG